MAASAPEMESLTIVELMQQFGSEDACHEALEELRWPDGVCCLRCGSVAISRIKERRQFDCDDCRYQFSVRVGTIFHDSKLPLWKWFLAVYMMAESRKGISANQIKRMLGVSYKTAWYLCHRIRAAMKDETPEQLRGIVEIDETWVGGKNYFKGRGKRLENKEMVMGAVERGGKVRLAKVSNQGKRTMQGFVKRVTHDDTQAYFTDEHSSYKGIGDENTTHATVTHSKLEWVNGQVHTNTIEGVWSLLKRSIIGSYHKVSSKHLPAYLDEISWRYNNRENPYLFRDTLLELIEAKPVEYKNLTA